MKKLGDRTIAKIEQIIVTPTTQKQKSPNKIRPSTARQVQAKPSPQPVKKSVSPINKTSRSIYIPMQKEDRLLQLRTQRLYQQLQRQSNFTIQNAKSIFLNGSNPRRPIYERTQEIILQRQANLEYKRLQQNKLNQEKQAREYEQYLKNLPPKKLISKHKAEMITQKLYKEHFAKTNRLNTQKMQQFREDSKYFRNRPLINQTTKEIYMRVAEKNKLSNDVVDRFKQYTDYKQKQKIEMEKQHKEKYYPFKPEISDNSKNIISARKEGEQLCRSHNCRSCNFIKTPENKKSFAKEFSVTFKDHSQFQ